MIETLSEFLRTQMLGTFLAPGSSLSLFALAINLAAMMVFLTTGIKRKRNVKLTSAWRSLFPNWLWRTSSGRADIAWLVYSLFGSGFLIGWALISSAWIAAEIEGWTGGASLITAPGWIVMPLATIAVYVSYEFAFWLDHFLMHKAAFLWRIHRVHHSAEHLSLFTNTRVHPLETIGFYNLAAVFMGVTQGAMRALLGPEATPAIIGTSNLLVLVSAVFITHLQHSRFWISFGPRWGRVFMGPAHHQLHHSADPDHHDCNLGGSLALFDRLFGTFLMPASKRQILDFGIGGEVADPHNLKAMTVAPIVEAGQVLLEGLRPAKQIQAAN